MKKVKWKHLYHDPFEETEDWYEFKEGELVSVVSGFLGIRQFGIIISDNHFYKVSLKDIIIAE